MPLGSPALLNRFQAVADERDELFAGIGFREE
ncbi:MAG: hypothetical protein ACI9OD_003242, partial [Limisphaerales bacterium]